MKLIDLHADTITTLYYDLDNFESDSEFIYPEPQSQLAKNKHRIDITKLQAADSMAQFFALWLNLEKSHKYNVSPWEHFLKLHKLLLAELAKSPNDIALATDITTLEKNNTANKISAFIGVEEGAFITKLDDLDTAYKMGVRYITLVWNYETHIGVPSFIDQTRGLKEFGFAMVEKMQELGILVDVSHLSDQGVRGVLSITKKPIIASHSDVRNLCNNKRNLPDELIKKIADNGGIIGVGCVPNFLDEVYKTIKIDTMVKHIQYIYNLAGIDVLALGNDFDGYKCYTPNEDEIKNISDVPKLADRLLVSGFTSSQVEKIFNLNVLRVLREYSFPT